MKFFVIFLVLIGFMVAMDTAFAGCIVNQDWPDAPCLDGIIDGYYEQHEVNQWAEYYLTGFPEVILMKY